jgi:hypothetical protein
MANAAQYSLLKAVNFRQARTLVVCDKDVEIFQPHFCKWGEGWPGHASGQPLPTSSYTVT